MVSGCGAVLVVGLGVGSALLSAVLALAVTSTVPTTGSCHLVGCWSGLSVQSGLVVGHVSGFSSSAYVAF